MASGIGKQKAGGATGAGGASPPAGAAGGPRPVVVEVDPDVEAALAELLPRVIPLLREALVRAKRASGRRRPAAVLREAPGDRERADDLSRARARELIERHTRRGR